MKLSIEGTSGEIKKILAAIYNSREDSELINIDNSNEPIVNPCFQEKLQKSDQQKQLKMGY
jgi:hypothetical protein